MRHHDDDEEDSDYEDSDEERGPPPLSLAQAADALARVVAARRADLGDAADAVAYAGAFSGTSPPLIGRRPTRAAASWRSRAATTRRGAARSATRSHAARGAAAAFFLSVGLIFRIYLGARVPTIAPVFEREREIAHPSLPP